MGQKVGDLLMMGEERPCFVVESAVRFPSTEQVALDRRQAPAQAVLLSSEFADPRSRIGREADEFVSGTPLATKGFDAVESFLERKKLLYSVHGDSVALSLGTHLPQLDVHVLAFLDTRPD
jgi:hypothetical protein